MSPHDRPSAQSAPHSPPLRLLYIVLGWCAVALAITGAFVPGLPTTIFVIGAAWCFSRSSPRFSRWLRAHPMLGPVLRRAAPGDGMPASAKRAALIAMWVAVLISSAVLLSVHWGAAVATIGLGVIGTLSILFAVRTTQPPAPASPTRATIGSGARSGRSQPRS